MHSRSFVAAFAVLSSLSSQPLGPQRRACRSVRRSQEFRIWRSTRRDAAATEHYYKDIIGAAKEPDPENAQGVRYAVSATQFIEVLPLPAGAGINRLDHAAFNTDSAEGMRKYLAAKGWTDAGQSVSMAPMEAAGLRCRDPEGNKVQFVQPADNAAAPDAPNAIGHHIIHVGFLVHDRAKEDTFYRDLLGFRPYWFGGMNDTKVDWVSQQVPDGHDWLEYMLTSGPSGTGIPANISQQHLGRVGSFLDRRGIGVRCLQDAGRRATGWAAGTTTHRRSARTARGSSISMIRTGFGWS